MESLPAEASHPGRKLDPNEVPDAVDLLIRAFERDPFVNWVVRSDRKRHEGMRRFFTVCLKQLTMPYGEVWVDREFRGIAMWNPPPGLKLSAKEQLHFLGQGILGMQLRHTPSRMAGFNELERHHPEVPHYYLFFLAVDPDCRGAGIGSRLLRATLDRCDAEGMPAYLEATREDLVPFYEHHGYRALPTVTLPYRGPTMYPMLRSPAA